MHRHILAVPTDLEDVLHVYRVPSDKRQMLDDLCDGDLGSTEDSVLLALAAVGHRAICNCLHAEDDRTDAYPCDDDGDLSWSDEMDLIISGSWPTPV